MIYIVEVNFEIEIEAESEDEADSVARYWDVRHPQHNRLPILNSFVQPEYVVVSKKERDVEKAVSDA